MTLFGAAVPDIDILHHDKFEVFSNEEENIREDIAVHDNKGFIYLITGLGVLAFGICKDWFVLRSSSVGQTLEEFEKVRPLLCIAPALTESVEDLLHRAITLKETGSLFIAANNCGTVRNWFRDGECCSLEREDEERCRDIRSFISVPKKEYHLRDGHDGKTVHKSSDGIYLARPPCRDNLGQHQGNVHRNTVFSWITPK